MEINCSALEYNRRKGKRAMEINVVGQPGLEPGTSVLSGLRSNQLSYWPGKSAFILKEKQLKIKLVCLALPHPEVGKSQVNQANEIDHGKDDGAG